MIIYQRYTDLSIAENPTPLNGEDISFAWLRKYVVWSRGLLADNYSRQPVSYYPFNEALIIY